MLRLLHTILLKKMKKFCERWSESNCRLPAAARLEPLTLEKYGKHSTIMPLLLTLFIFNQNTFFVKHFNIFLHHSIRHYRNTYKDFTYNINKCNKIDVFSLLLYVKSFIIIINYEECNYKYCLLY